MLSYYTLHIKNRLNDRVKRQRYDKTSDPTDKDSYTKKSTAMQKNQFKETKELTTQRKRRILDTRPKLQHLLWGFHRQ